MMKPMQLANTKFAHAISRHCADGVKRDGEQREQRREHRVEHEREHEVAQRRARDAPRPAEHLERVVLETGQRRTGRRVGGGSHGGIESGDAAHPAAGGVAGPPRRDEGSENGANGRRAVRMESVGPSPTHNFLRIGNFWPGPGEYTPTPPWTTPCRTRPPP
jgi:hypothetical protein